MKAGLAMGIVVAALMLDASGPVLGVAQELPVVKGQKVVAKVQGETITLYEFNQQLAAMKQEGGPGATVDRSEELALLNRMISTTLIAQEARRMELHKLPENRKMLDSFSRIALREELVERVIKDVKADPKEVDELYRAAVREWKVSAALFSSQEHATSFAAEIASGKDFVEVAKAFVAQGRATKVEDGVVLRGSSIDPAIGEAVSKMAVGTISPVVAAKSGPVVLKLEDIRYADNPGEKVKAEQIVLLQKRREAVTAFDEELRKKYVKVNQDLLKSIDYESDKPGIDALLKDRRVVVEVKGEQPVTVGELTEQLKFQFFHGTQMAAERKRLNARKEQVLDGIVHRKVFRKEALRLKLDKTKSYKIKVKDYETSVLFGTFLRKVIAPDIKVADGDVKAHYEAHRSDYSTPEMVRLRSLAFADRRSAERAAESLRKGADFQWVADHADGQVDRNAKGVVLFDGRPIMTTELPDEVEKAVAGARTGDVRVYGSPEGHFYALAVQDMVAAQPQPYEDVRGAIVKKVVEMKARKAVEDYAARLRSLSEVKIYLGAS